MVLEQTVLTQMLILVYRVEVTYYASVRSARTRNAHKCLLYVDFNATIHVWLLVSQALSGIDLQLGSEL